MAPCHFAHTTLITILLVSTPKHGVAEEPIKVNNSDRTSLAQIMTEMGYSELKVSAVNGHHFVTITVAAQEVRMLLDTGSQATFLHPDLAKKAKLNLSEKQKRVLTAFGETRIRTAEMTDYSLGKLKGPPISVDVEDDPVIFDENRGGLKADGLIGSDVLEYYSAVIDYSGPSLYLIEPWRKEKRLQGKWLAKSCVQSGKAVEGLTDTSIEIEQDKFVYSSGGQEAKYRLVVGSLAQKPVKMQWATEDPKKAAAGIFKFDGDDLIICMQGPKAPDQFPDKFESTKENEFVLFRFQRVKVEK